MMQGAIRQYGSSISITFFVIIRSIARNTAELFPIPEAPRMVKESEPPKIPLHRPPRIPLWFSYF